MLQNKSVYLNPPVHRVKSQYDYRNIEVVVFNDGEEIYRNNNCDIREIIGGYQVRTDKIELTKPIGKLRYKLVAGNEVIYDSKNKLCRNYIVLIVMDRKYVTTLILRERFMLFTRRRNNNR